MEGALYIIEGSGKVINLKKRCYMENHIVPFTKIIIVYKGKIRGNIYRRQKKIVFFKTFGKFR